MKKQSFFMRIFVATVLMSTALLLVSGFVFRGVLLRSSEAHIGQMRMENTRNLVKHVDSVAVNLKRNALHMSLLLNNAWKAALGETSRTPAEQISFNRGVYEILMSVARTNNSLYSTYIYLENTDTVVSSHTGIYSRADFVDNSWMEEYDNIVLHSTGVWLPTRTVTTSVTIAPVYERTSVVTYIYKLSPYITPGLSGAFVFNLKESYLSKLLNDASATPSERVVVYSADGIVLSDVDKANLNQNHAGTPELEKILSSNDNSGYFTQETDGVLKIVSYYKSDFQGWIFVEYASLEPLRAAMTSSLYNLVLLVAGLIAAAFVLAFVVSRALYDPVKKLVEEVTAGQGYTSSEHKDLMILKKAVSELHAFQESLHNDSAARAASEEEMYLRNMIHEGASETEPPSAISGKFGSGAAIAVLLSDDTSISVHHQSDTEKKFTLRNLMLQLIKQIVLDDTMKQTGFFLKDDALVFVHYPPGIRPDEQELRRRLSQYAGYISDTMGISVTCGMSLPFKGVEGIQEAYGETITAARRKLFEGYGKVISIRQVPEAREYEYPLEEEAAILNNLLLMRELETEESVRGFFDALRSMTETSVDHALLILHQLTGSIFKLLLQIGIRDSNYIKQAEELLYASHATSYLWIDEYEERLKNQLLGLCRSIRSSSQRTADIYNRMMDYIHENYRKDIGIEEIADYLDISYSYTRKIFRDSTGKNILDYINELRIEEAKKLLLDTDDTLAQIASALGYNNNQSLTRYFKKYTGVSPGAFRRSRTEQAP